MSEFILPDLDAYAADLERIKAKASQQNNYGDTPKTDVFWYAMRDGDNILFILPPVKNSRSKKINMDVYRIKGLPPFNGRPQGTMHQCIELTHPELGIKCPILAAKEIMKAKGLDTNNYKVEKKVYFNVIDFNGNPDASWEETKKDGTKFTRSCNQLETPHIVGLSSGTADKIISMMFDPTYANFFDPNNAIPIIINKSGAGLNTRYTVSAMTTVNENRQAVPMRVPIHRDPNMIPSILDKCTDLFEYFSAPVDELKPEGNITKSVNMMLQQAPPPNVPNPTAFNPNMLPQNQQPVYNPPVQQAPPPPQQQYNPPQQQYTPPVQNPPQQQYTPPPPTGTGLPAENQYTAYQEVADQILPYTPSVQSQPVQTHNPPPPPPPPSMQSAAQVSNPPAPKHNIPGAPDCYGTYGSQGDTCTSNCKFSAICKHVTNNSPK